MYHILRSFYPFILIAILIASGFGFVFAEANITTDPTGAIDCNGQIITQAELGINTSQDGVQWFYFIAPDSGELTISSMFQTEVNTLLKVYNGCDMTLLHESDVTSLGADENGDDIIDYQQSLVTLTAVNERDTIVMQWTNQESSDSFNWSLNFNPHDIGQTCDQPIPIKSGTVYDRRIEYGTETWFSYTMPHTGVVEIFWPEGWDIELFQNCENGLLTNSDSYTKLNPTCLGHAHNCHSSYSIESFGMEGDKLFIHAKYAEYQFSEYSPHFHIEVTHEESWTCDTAQVAVIGINDIRSKPYQWYEYTFPSDGELMIISDEALGIAQSCGGNLLARNDAFDQCRPESEIFYNGKAGEKIYILWYAGLEFDETKTYSWRLYENYIENSCLNPILLEDSITTWKYGNEWYKVSMPGKGKGLAIAAHSSNGYEHRLFRTYKSCANLEKSLTQGWAYMELHGMTENEEVLIQIAGKDQWTACSETKNVPISLKVIETQPGDWHGNPIKVDESGFFEGLGGYENKIVWLEYEIPTSGGRVYFEKTKGWQGNVSIEVFEAGDSLNMIYSWYDYHPYFNDPIFITDKKKGGEKLLIKVTRLEFYSSPPDYRLTLSILPYILNLQTEANKLPKIENKKWVIPSRSENSSMTYALNIVDSDSDAIHFRLDTTQSIFSLDTTGVLSFNPEDLVLETNLVVLNLADPYASTTDTLYIFKNRPPNINNQSFTVPNKVVNSEIIGTLQTNDPNSDSVNVTILSGNDNGAFALDPITHQFTISDHQKVGEVHELLVVANDQLDTDTATISIVRNHPPVIEDQAFVFAYHISEGAVVGKLEVSDLDNTSVNLTILSGNDKGTFTLDQESNEITISDSQNITEIHELRVLVQDQFDTDTATLTIIRNQPPIIVDQSFIISRSALDGEVIGTLESADGNNDTLSVNILSGNDNGAFALDATTHQIAIADIQKVVDGHELLVVVKDQYDSDTAKVTFTFEPLDVFVGASKIYPNPADAFVKVESQNLKELSIYDLGGQLVKRSNNQELDVSELGEGIYILRIYLKNGTLTERKLTVRH